MVPLNIRQRLGNQCFNIEPDMNWQKFIALLSYAETDYKTDCFRNEISTKITLDYIQNHSRLLWI